LNDQVLCSLSRYPPQKLTTGELASEAKEGIFVKVGGDVGARVDVGAGVGGFVSPMFEGDDDGDFVGEELGAYCKQL